MNGLNQHNGQAIDGLAHLYQSIAIILTTPIGSRIARRNFGSDLHKLIDAPNNKTTRVRLFAATAKALMRWEPRLKVSRISLSTDPDHPELQFIDIEGTTTLSSQLISTRVAINVKANL